MDSAQQWDSQQKGMYFCDLSRFVTWWSWWIHVTLQTLSNARCMSGIWLYTFLTQGNWHTFLSCGSACQHRKYFCDPISSWSWWWWHPDHQVACSDWPWPAGLGHWGDWVTVGDDHYHDHDSSLDWESAIQWSLHWLRYGISCCSCLPSGSFILRMGSLCCICCIRASTQSDWRSMDLDSIHHWKTNDLKHPD